MTQQFDIIIVGGGMVGATLACALAKTGQFSVAVVEAFPLLRKQASGKTNGKQGQDELPAYTPSYDARSTALSEGSCRMLAGLGLLAAINERAEAIKQIHVSDQGKFGVTRISCDEEEVESFGRVVENPWFGQVLINALHDHEGITLFSPAKVVALVAENTAEENSSGAVQVQVDTENGPLNLKADLLVAADGEESACCRYLHIDKAVHDYGQSALVANLTPVKAHQNIAYERFTESGPMALLPLVDDRFALVFTVPANDSDYYLNMDDRAFIKAVNERIGGRVGGFNKVGERACYPLKLMRAKEQIRPACVVLGNAAHSLHPVAGQGLNLSLRDVAFLSSTLSAAKKNGQHIGSLPVLESYLNTRALDQETTIQFSDKLMRLFSNNSAFLSAGRNLGMVALDLWPGGKKILTRHAMGLSAGIPDL